MEDKNFTAEETAAMEAMQADTAPVTDEEQEAAAKTEVEPEQPEEPKTVEQEEQPEFKSVRDNKPPEGFVPHGAMHQERERRKAAEDELAAIRARVDDLEAERKPSDPEWKDPLEDPEGHRKWTEFQAQKAREDAIAEFKKQAEADTAREARRASAARAEQEFMQKNADYPNAAQHLHQVRVQELAAQGLTHAEINQQVAQEANQIFDLAQTLNINPAQLIYMKAQEMGYAKPAPKEDPAQKIEHLAEAQKKVQGVGAVGGAAQKGGLTIAQMAEMSDDDFAKLDPAEKRKAMGG